MSASAINSLSQAHPMTIEEAKKRTLADYRPQHDEYCGSRKCARCQGTTRFHAEILSALDNPHAFEASPCSCGLDHLLEAVRHESAARYASVSNSDYVDWGSGELLAMTALDNYPIPDDGPKSTSVVYRIHQLGRAYQAARYASAHPIEKVLADLNDLNRRMDAAVEAEERGESPLTAWHASVEQPMEENDHGASLLPVDPSAAMTSTETLPNWSAIDRTKDDFYERRLREEWEAIGGTTHGTWFYHPLLPGFSGDSRCSWGYLVRELQRQAGCVSVPVSEASASLPSEAPKSPHVSSPGQEETAQEKAFAHRKRAGQRAVRGVRTR